MSAIENTQVQVQRHYERVIPAGQVIFERGDPGDVLFVVHSGTVELSRATAESRKVLARLGPGEFFGEMSVVVGEPRTARAEAITECRLLELDAETFEAMCVDRPEIAIRVIRRLTARLIESDRRLAALGVDELLRPVVRALVRHAEPDPEHGTRVATSLRTLSSESGLSMLDTHRALQQLLDQKLVRLADDVLVASDLDGLNACIDVPA